MCLVEFLQAGDGLDVGVDPAQVAAVTGGQDAPVLQMCDRLLHRDSDRGEPPVERNLWFGQVSPRLLLNRGDRRRPLITLVGNQAARTIQKPG